MNTKMTGIRTGGILAVVLAIANSAHAQAGSANIGTKMVQYCEAKLSTRVGGGSNSHLVTEALRVAGGEFVPDELGADAPSTGDRVWGTLVTIVSRTDGNLSDSAPNEVCQPGDIIQFGSAVLGSANLPEHFTAVVALVDAQGRPSGMYYQGWNGNRRVQMASMDVAALSSGWMRIYRSVARTDRSDEWKFTIVNNDVNSQSYEILIGIDSEGVYEPTAADTRSSFRIHWVKTDGTVPNVLSSIGGSYFLETTKGYEIYNSSGVGIRQLQD